MPSLDSFELPPRKNLADFLAQEPASTSGKNTVFAKVEKAPRKGKSWSEEEHLAFLTGLAKLGKGNWRGIARYYVPTRTSTQIASHAQKYLQRVSGTTKRKSKFSEIEQQANDMQMMSSPHPAPSNSSEESRNRLAPAGSTHTSESDEAGWRYKAPGPEAFPETVCRPKPVRPVEREPDLMLLAHSLSSLSSSHRLSPSDTSAFRIAEAVRD